MTADYNYFNIDVYRSLSEWRALVGEDGDGPLRMEFERQSGESVSSPKHGKVGW